MKPSQRPHQRIDKEQGPRICPPEHHENVIKGTRAAIFESNDPKAPIGLTDAPSASDSELVRASTNPSTAGDEMLSLGKAVQESDDQLIPHAEPSSKKPDEINLLKLCPEFTLTGDRREEQAPEPPADANRTGRRQPTTRRRRPLLPPAKEGLWKELLAWLKKPFQ